MDILLPPIIGTGYSPDITSPPSQCPHSVPQVIATAPYNPLLVLVGVPAIPAVLVMLEGVDLDGRFILADIVNIDCICFPLWLAS